MIKQIVALLFIVSMINSNNTFLQDDKISMFKNFIAQHNKDYSIREFYQKFNIFIKNLDRYAQIFGEEHPGVIFSPFMDMTEEEFSSRLNFRPDFEQYNSLPTLKFEADDTPDAIDWRSKGRVTPIKDQGACGSCWAFSTIGNLESENIKVNGNTVILSEQQLVDCDTEEDQGCNGGLMENALEYISNYGSQSQESYPYTARDETCKYNSNEVKVKIDKYYKLDNGEDVLKDAVAKFGPISVAVNATPWQLYFGGVFNPVFCSSQLNHGVLAVGYGTSSTGKNYWIIKNSWGTSWGENGYIRLIKDKDMCGISTYNTRADVAKN